MTTVAAFVDATWRRAMRPDPTLTVSEWADSHRFLSQRASAEPGRWRTDRTPYLREVMDCLSASSPIERVVMMAGAQLGKTESGNNWLGYIIAQAPGPAMAVSPTVELAKRASRQRIDPLIEESPALRDLVAPARARDSGNTVLSKEFPGGLLVMTGANSAAALRSMPVRYLFLDEVDAYPPDADGEGDPVGLAIKRTATFARRKILMTSTPTTAGLSRIEAAFLESDQRRYFVPCPYCRVMQTLLWERVRWSDLGIPPDQAVYLCEACEQPIGNNQKSWMLPRGEWRPTAKSDGKTAGFHLSSLYSPAGWYAWGEAACDFVKAGKNPNRLKVFVNTVLGEPFRETSEAPDWERLFQRREDYPLGKVPMGGLMLTAGADVQKDRVEVEIVAWGRGRESWSVDHLVFEGDPQQPAVWRQLDKLMGRSFDHAAGGLLPIERLAIDTGGHWTTEVYSWVARQDPTRIMAIKGVHGASVALGAPSYVEVNANGVRLRRGARLWPVGVSLVKGTLYGWLRQEPPRDGQPTPEGYCHFPRYGEEYFKQLTGERLVRRTTKAGFTKLDWEKSRPRNEALDMRVYAIAASMAQQLDRWTEADWREAEAAVGVTRTDPAEEANAVRQDGPTLPTTVKSRWMSRS